MDREEQVHQSVMRALEYQKENRCRKCGGAITLTPLSLHRWEVTCNECGYTETPDVNKDATKEDIAKAWAKAKPTLDNFFKQF